jgi:hypothetical protein
VERRAVRTDVPFLGKERRQPQRRANARVAPRLWLHGALCLAFATYYYDNTVALIAFAPIYAMVYTLNYRIAERLTEGPPPGSRPGIQSRSE